MRDAETIAAEMLARASSGLSHEPGSVLSRLLQVPAEQFAGCLQMMEDVLYSRWIEDAYGASLDAIGARFAIPRAAGESDSVYRARIEHTIAMRLSYGTVADIKRFVSDLLGMTADDIEVIEWCVQEPDAVFMLRIHGQPTKDADWDSVNQTVRDVKGAGICYLAEDLILALLPVELVLDAGQFTQCYVWLPACSGWGYMQWGTCPWGGGEETVTIECSGFEEVDVN